MNKELYHPPGEMGPLPSSNVVYLDTNIGIPSEALIADPVLANLIECAKQQQKMLKAQQMALDLLKSEIKKAMGSHELALLNDGSIAATYSWVKGAETVDREALRVHFADVYEICKKIGEPTRRLELK